jgi:hypothetical protein
VNAVEKVREREIEARIEGEVEGEAEVGEIINIAEDEGGNAGERRDFLV